MGPHRGQRGEAGEGSHLAGHTIQFRTARHQAGLFMRRFTIPIFGPKVHFTDCPDEAFDWLNKKGADLGSREFAGFTVQAGSDILIFAPSIPVLAHEAYHAAVMVLQHIGAEEFDEEVTAYLIQHITEKCLG